MLLKKHQLHNPRKKVKKEVKSAKRKVNTPGLHGFTTDQRLNIKIVKINRQRLNY